MKTWCVLFIACLLGCTTSYEGVPKQYTRLLNTAFQKAGEHAGELKKALENCQIGRAHV